jgi:chemotaxis protein methyltransferase CheR
MADTEGGGATFGMRMTRAQFDRVASMMYSASKVSLQDGKEELVKSRLSKRIRELGLPSFDAYLSLVGSSPAELYQMVDLLTTNKTNFFRENAHFEFMKSRILPGVRDKRLRIWSAGCSSGEEPYTIAMVLREFFGEGEQHDLKVLATDLSMRVLQKAKAGVYEEETLRDLPPMYQQRYFDCVDHNRPRKYSARHSLRSLITFAPLNLMEEWPMRGPFDLIFCRNVMIYFDKPTQETLVRRYWGMLRPGGYLFVGHSESLAGMTNNFKYIQPAVHLKF